METTKTIDPMCGKELPERDPKYASEIDGKIQFFCSEDCKRKFDRGAAVVAERMAASKQPIREIETPS